MISRRIIRIKVLQILYAFFTSPETSINNTEKELFFSLQKTYDLYHYLMALIIEIEKFAEERIALGLKKHRPTSAELDPNTRFVNNLFIGQLKSNISLNKYLESSKLSWNNDNELIRKLYLSLIDQEFYKVYMDTPENSYSVDRKLVEDIFKYLVLDNDDIESLLEEQSIYWNDDLDFVVSMILKTFKKFKEFSDERQELLPMYKDDEDRQFAKDLYRKVILNHSDNVLLIKQHTVNWDIERIAFIDNLILELALSEFLYFPSIPTKVTMNEYIELSKYYSTDKSRNFINGILDKALKDLKKDNKIHKAGRGLIGEEEE
ncbi:MAG TPA: transcription antitermination factor NusB [Prolixibacteraceae bacterium]|nr:transcription antitermination factor NusB [Prolixibacteraceae bacterium]